MTRTKLFLIVFLLGLLAGLLMWAQRENPTPSLNRSEDPVYVGMKICAECHTEQVRQWSGSHHDLAMQPATEKTVRGSFDGATITAQGVTSKFFKKDGRFMVRTDGPDGLLHEYAISYAFGDTPLQQYLIEFPGGRYQALGLAWDTRAQEEGGQQWFHLYPNEWVSPPSSLHWTGRDQTWNYMCAECHSTDLKKRYDLVTDTYATVWSELNVSCEACHGPGSAHVQWAKARQVKKDSAEAEAKGLRAPLKDHSGGMWLFNPGDPIARRTIARTPTMEIDMCARCHSRRSVIHEDYVHGRPLLDSHLPALLEEPLYHADGQINEEVYVYGSFIQSKMYRAGVLCSDCHEPHSLKLRAAGNSLCAGCHAPAAFETPEHHFHKTGSAGANCTECHMPAKTYMVVDPRRDHSFRIPKPRLSQMLGTPNACTGCHQDRTPAWAERTVTKWYGTQRQASPHYGEALAAGRLREPNAGHRLAQLAQNQKEPGIARATALSLLQYYPSEATMAAIRRGAADKDSLVRLGAMRALRGVPVQYRIEVAEPLLRDPVRAVRIEAARATAPVPAEALSAEQNLAWEQTAQEYFQAQEVNADRPESHLNIGVLHAEHGQHDRAEAAYHTALRLDPGFVPALVNLADLYRAQQQDDRGESLLRRAIELEPDNATVHQAMGLWLVRQGKPQEALRHFEKAATSAPNDPSYGYFYGLALHSTQHSDQAIRTLEQTVKRHPSYKPLLVALVSINQETGQYAMARRYAERLAELDPEDREARRMLADLPPARP
jgi:predicted CXXCH cytochrome family protein